jgi:hypothetical protein
VWEREHLRRDERNERDVVDGLLILLVVGSDPLSKGSVGGIICGTSVSGMEYDRKANGLLKVLNKAALEVQTV